MEMGIPRRWVEDAGKDRPELAENCHKGTAIYRWDTVGVPMGYR